MRYIQLSSYIEHPFSYLTASNSLLLSIYTNCPCHQVKYQGNLYTGSALQFYHVIWPNSMKNAYLIIIKSIIVSQYNYKRAICMLLYRMENQVFYFYFIL